MKISIKDIEPYLQSLSPKQKDKLLYQILKKDQDTVEKLYYNHIAGSDGLDDRYDEYKELVRAKLFDYYRARADELILAKAISEAKKVINEFKKIDKRPEKEAELLMVILEEVFDRPPSDVRFGTCWTKYDHVVAQTLKRLITLIKTKLHEDHLMDYKPQIDKYVFRLKSASSFNDFVWELPDEL